MFFIDEYFNNSRKWKYTNLEWCYKIRGGGHLNVTGREGGTHFYRISKTCLGKKAYFSWTDTNSLFRNFWSIFTPSSGMYAEKWYPEKRHVPYKAVNWILSWENLRSLSDRVPGTVTKRSFSYKRHPDFKVFLRKGWKVSQILLSR